MRLSIYLLLITLAFTGCVDDEDNIPNLDDVTAPSELSLDFAIANDNSGTVSILPGARGATLLRIDFGDGTGETAEMAPGETASRVYTEGTYTVTLTAIGINGRETTMTQELSVSFAAPQNLMVLIEPITGNALGIRVSATADLETDFAVYFGENDDEEPTVFTEGETVDYTYSAVGTYTVRVVARSGGSQTAEESVEVTVSDPLTLPVTFDDRDVEIFGFGGANPAIVGNPDPNEANSSSRVVQVTKTSGSEVWAGVVFELGQPIDFSNGSQIQLTTWSPDAGIPVLVKLENSTDPNVFIEVTVNTTVASGWEVLTANFGGGDLSQEYSKIAVFFDFGTAGQGKEYYFDAVTQTDGVPELGLPLDFEISGEGIYSFTGFGGAGAGVQPNPDQSGINTSATVVEFRKGVGSEVWGGVFIDLDAPIDFSSSQMVSVKVWSPKVGAPILLKIENPDNGDENREISVNTTTSGEWEELVFNLSGIETLNNQRRVVIFADFGTSGDDIPYYFDDFRLQ